MVSEIRGFVFAVVFIVVFATLLVSIPVGLQGIEETPDTVVPIDPSLVAGFEETENWTRAAYTAYTYEYDLGVHSWYSADLTTAMSLGAKVLIWGIFWFGAVDSCRFTSPEGVNRGFTLEFTEVTADATEGSASYALQLSDSGNTAGNLVCYWNTTKYANASIAWTNDELYLLHGIGFENTATNNIGALLVSLLFLQLPEVPTLVNIFLAVPVWACVIFILWFVIKEMIPFLG